MHSKTSSRRQRGVALVVVLACVVLLTGVVVAYLSRVTAHRQLSNSSFNQAKVDELARSALDIITSELKQEIAVGSTTSTVGNTSIYTPTSGTFMMPLRNPGTATSGTHGTATGTYTLQTLLRLSSTNALTVVGTTVGCVASNASSTGTSANARSITPARWNSHYLNPRGDPSSTAIDSSPNGACSLVVTPPSWIFVTNQGPTVLTSPTSNVIGRYAYAMYDEGALLDINAAGYPTALPAMGYAAKGALAFADLTQIPCAATTYLTGADVNNIIGWRNYATAQASGTLGAFTISTAGAAAYYDAVVTNTTGFLRVATSSSNGRTDQAFLSRQQLLALRRTLGFSQNALPYLGTFSRAVTAPSWKPVTPASSSIDYAALADGANAANRNIPNVRFPNAAPIVHYNDDATTTNYSVVAGDLLLQRRFSLKKLAWLGSAGPDASAFASSVSSAVQAQAIQACFGLRWNGAQWRWDYVGPAGSAAVSSIETLAQVADEGREPNFFEMLKAGILSGSLGRDPGPGVDVVSPLGKGVYASQYDTYKADKDLQVLQIGANILDQFDTDSYPTAIYLRAFNFASTPIDELAINTVYGIENLPGLYALVPIAIADPLHSAPNPALKFWLQTALWNPHQVPATPLSGYPAGFRGYAYGRAYGVWQVGAGSLNNAPKTYYDDRAGTPMSTTLSGGYLGEFYFSNPVDGTSPFYSKPNLMTLDLVSTSGSSIVDTASTPVENYYDATKWNALAPDLVATAKINQFVGFSLVSDTKYTPNTVNLPMSAQIFPDLTIPLYVSLQYKGTDGGYHPYNFMARIAQSGATDQLLRTNAPGGLDLAHVTLHIDGQTRVDTGWGGMRVDPRTDRFSEATQGMQNFRGTGTEIAKTLNPGPNSSFPIYGAGTGSTGGYAVPISPAFVYDPPISSSIQPYPSLWATNMTSAQKVLSVGSQLYKAYYADPDGVVRYADNYRRNDAKGDGCQMYHGDASVTGPASTLAIPKSTASPPGSAQVRRPVILNRPFRSVGELGYAYRDLPFKSLDFWSPTSADSALLDLFSVNDMPPVVAGQLNLNNAPAPVLQAVIAGGSKSEILADAPNGVQISPTDTLNLVAKIMSDIAANGHYGNRADLATRLGPLVSGSGAGYAFDTTLNTASKPYSNWANKACAEMPMRALVDVTNTRTWNLLIDVVAQTGSFTRSTPATTAALNSSFVVQGERRYWLHIAIDRFTGKVVDQQLEPVYE